LLAAVRVFREVLLHGLPVRQLAPQHFTAEFTGTFVSVTAGEVLCGIGERYSVLYLGLS
jgi:hypothetical protein